jgi:hypothetical protein
MGDRKPAIFHRSDPFYRSGFKRNIKISRYTNLKKIIYKYMKTNNIKQFLKSNICLQSDKKVFDFWRCQIHNDAVSGNSVFPDAKAYFSGRIPGWKGILASLALVFSLSAATGWGQTTTTINFDTVGNWTQGGATAFTSYSNHSYSESNWSFTGARVIRNTTAVQDVVAGAFGTYSWRLEDGVGARSLTATFNSAATITAFGFDVRRWDNTPDPSYTIEYSTNSGTNWTSTGTTINNAYLGSSAWKTFTFSLPSSSAVTSGQFRVRVVGSAGERIMIDNFQWTVGAAAAPSITLADNGSQVGASSVAAGTASVILHQSSLAVTAANATLTGVSFTTAGTYSASDVSNFKVWYSADNSFSSSTDTLLGTISSSLGAGAKSVSSLNQVINSGSTGYLFITSDIAASPTGGVTLSVSALITSDVTFSSGTKSGSTTAGGAKTLQAAALPNGPALSAAGSATVDGDFNVTFAENATWRGAISGVTVDGTALTAGWSASTSGQITFTPSASNPANLLRTPGSKTIVVSATGYNPNSVTQSIGVGQPAKLAITTQPTAPADNGAALAVQPVVVIRDQYDNLTTSTASVVATKGDAGSWTLGGTTTVAAISGTATFSGLTATSTGAVTGATITFSSGSLTAATSNPGFNIPAPNHISLATAGTPVTENFNSLASTGTSSLLPLGWYILESGSSANTTYAAGTGSDTGGNTYSFGASGSSDRALGGLQSGTVNPSWGVKAVNNTGATITTLAISYTGETWRVGAANRSDRIDFQYSTDATSLSTGTWTDANSLDYANPGQAATGSGSIQHSATISGAITGLNIANGATVWIRWTDFDATNADDGMAVEDFSIVVPVAPTIATGTAGSITATGVTITGNNVSADGGSAITERGVVYGTSTNPTTSATKVTSTGTTGTYNSTLTGLLSGTTYYVRAYAINAVGTSYGSDVTVLTLPGAPATPTVSGVTTTGFTANWSATTGASSYRLDISTASNFATFVSSYGDLTVNGTSQAVTGLTPGTTYYARVRAVNASGTGANSATLTQATTGVPEIAVESPVGTGVASGGSRADFGTLTVNSTADFTFRVLNSGSAALSVTGITFGGTHASDFTVVGGSTATIAAGGSQDFTIRFTPGADGARTGTVTFANDDSDEGTYVISLSGTGSAAPVAPTVTSSAASLITATGVTLNGNVNADGGAGITERGFVYSSSDSTPTIEEGATKVTTTGTTGSASEAVTGLANSTLYYFRVYASNSAGTSYGSVLSFTTLKGQPALHVTGFAAGTITTANIPSIWTGATADGYLLRVSSTTVSDPNDGTAVGDDTDLSDGAGTINLASNVTSYSSFTGFAAGTTYTFKLYPYHNSGVNIDYLVADAPSFSAKLLPVAPGSVPTFASVTATGFTVNWSAVTGADSYRLDVSTASNFSSFVGGYENLEVTGGTSQAVTGLSANTQYFARVRAVNTAGTGASSSTGNQTTSQLSAPTTLAASSITSSGFTANWNTVTGATGYSLDLIGQTNTSDDFEDGNLTSNLVWSGDTSSYSVLTSTTLPNGLASTDGFYLGVNSSVGNSTLTTPSSETAEWRFSLGSTTFNPATSNFFGVILMSSAAITGDPIATGTSWNGYYLKIGVDGPTDPVELWRRSGTTSTKVGDFSGSPNYGTGALEEGINVRITRSAGGVFELFTSSGFTYSAAPTTSRGTLTDSAHITSSHFGIFTRFSNPATTRRVYLDNLVLPNATRSITLNTLALGDVSSQGITGLSSATQYSYVVRATSATSTSANSDVRAVTTKGTSSITVNSGTTSLTYSGSAQGPTFTVTGSTGALSYSYAGTGATTYGPTATAPTNVGTYTVTATVAADANFDGATSSATAFSIQAATLGSGAITLTPVVDGSYTASAAGVSGFTLSYAGRSANGVTTSYASSASAPTLPGFYTVTATSSDANYSGSKSENYFIAGLVAGNDSVTKPTDNSRIKIPVATLLANDGRILGNGTVQTATLSITGVTQGTGTAASISGAFVLFTPANGNSGDSFTYTLTDSSGNLTATGTVTVSPEAAPPSFDLQIVGQGTASYNGTQTSITMDFIGVPNQSYTVEYKGDLAEASWTSAGAQSTGSTGSFSVTFTKAGDHTTDWNGSMFFRASVAP